MSVKILYVISGLKRGGAEQQLFNLASHLPKQYKPVIAALQGGPFEQAFKNKGIRVYVLDVRSFLQDGIIVR